MSEIPGCPMENTCGVFARLYRSKNTPINLHAQLLAGAISQRNRKKSEQKICETLNPGSCWARTEILVSLLQR